MLTQEFGTASNIKSRVNRLSVLAAITSTQQRLKLYNRVPPNGLVLFVGTILTDEGKEKKVSFDFEPHKPINTYEILLSLLLFLSLNLRFSDLFIFVTINFTLRRFLSFSSPISASGSWLWMVTERFSVFWQATLVRSCTNSRSIFPRSTDVVVNQPYVSHGFAMRSVTTTFAKLLSCQSNTSLRTTRSM